MSSGLDVDDWSTLTLNVDAARRRTRQRATSMSSTVVRFLWFQTVVQALIGELAEAASSGTSSSTSCPPACFCNAPSRIVYCSRRGLTAVPQGIAANSLQLNLNGNVFASSTLRRGNFSGLSSLEHLYLSECRIERLEVSDVCVAHFGRIAFLLLLHLLALFSTYGKQNVKAYFYLYSHVKGISKEMSLDFSKTLPDSMAICNSSHAPPTSLLGTDCGPQSPTVCSFLLSDFLLSVAAPFLSLVFFGTRIWNGLPSNVASSPSLFTFKQQLKMYLFHYSYPGLSYQLFLA